MNGRRRALLLAGSTAFHAAAGVLGLSAGLRADGLPPLLVYLQPAEPPSTGASERLAGASPPARLARVPASGRALLVPSTSAVAQPRSEQTVPQPVSVVAEAPPAAAAPRGAAESEHSAAVAADSLPGSREAATAAPSLADAASLPGSGGGGQSAAVTGLGGEASPPSGGSSPNGEPSAFLAGGGGAGAGNGSRLARATPAEGGDGVPAEYGGYLSRFRRSVQEALRYPLAARRRGLEGVVQLDVEIDPTGRVRSVEVAASSSHAMLDEAAVDAVRRLAPLPLPEHLRARVLRVRLPLVFRLE